MDSKRLMFQLLEKTINKNLPLPKTEAEKLAVIIFELIENNFEYRSSRLRQRGEQ